MSGKEGRDRYNFEHRKDSSFVVGESMPGTFGDSDGTIHDRLGGQPTIDMDEVEKVSVPGDKARNEAEAKRKEQAVHRRTVQDLLGETVAIEITGREDDSAFGITNNHRVYVPNASKGETVLVELSDTDGQLTGKRLSLFE